MRYSSKPVILSAASKASEVEARFRIHMSITMRVTRVRDASVQHAGEEYAKQIKPFNVFFSAQVRAFGRPIGVDLMR